jgi:hypothetical protein
VIFVLAGEAVKGKGHPRRCERGNIGGSWFFCVKGALLLGVVFPMEVTLIAMRIEARGCKD